MADEIITRILDFVESDGLAAFAFLVMAYLFWRQQNLMKSRDATDAIARQAETAQQNRILDMYVRFDKTLSILNDTLKNAFTVTHDDSVKTNAALESQAVGISALTDKIGTLENTMSEHTEKTPTLIEMIETIQRGITELGGKIDAVGERFQKEVGDIRDELDSVKKQTDEVKAKVTQETHVVIPAVEPSVKKVVEAKTITERTDK
jgi:uncharacterized phage infection (PIP) family protein YhgE